MIGFATPARRSCVTVDACRRLCAGCTVSGTAATQWACRNCASVWPVSGPPAKMWHNTDPHSAVACSTSPRQQLSISYRLVASTTDVGWPCHYPLWPYVPTLDSWVSMWVRDWKEMWKTGQIFVISRVRWSQLCRTSEYVLTREIKARGESSMPLIALRKQRIM